MNKTILTVYIVALNGGFGLCLGYIHDGFSIGLYTFATLIAVLLMSIINWD